MIRRRWYVFATIPLLTVALSAQAPGPRGGGGQRAGGAPAAPAMTLTVSGFNDGGQIPVKFS